MRIFIVIYLIFIVCSFGWASESQKVIDDDSKVYQEASLRWKSSELIGCNYRDVKDNHDISYFFSDQYVMVSITVSPKPGSFICPLMKLYWSIDDKGILNMDGAPVFKWTDSWMKLEEHSDKVVVVNKNGQRVTYIRSKK